MKTQEIIDKLKKGLDAEYYLVASGSTRTKDNKDLTLTVKEAQHICSLLDVRQQSELLLCPKCGCNKFADVDDEYWCLNVNCKNEWAKE